MKQLIGHNFAQRREYLAAANHLSFAPLTAETQPLGRLPRAASLIAILLSSLGLWVAIWAVVASLA